MASEVYDYMMERQRNAWLEPPDGGPPIPGITPEACDAVLASRPRSPLEFDARLRALLEFLALPEAASLTAANKRAANLLKKSAGAETASGQINAALFKVDAERNLHEGLLAAEHSVPGRIAVGEYAQALAELARLRPAVDAFFDQVMVMDPDARSASEPAGTADAASRTVHRHCRSFEVTWMILYGTSVSPFVRKVMMFAAEKGIALETQPTRSARG